MRRNSSGEFPKKKSWAQIPVYATYTGEHLDITSSKQQFS